jgi:chromosome segregation ATPase
MANDNNKLNKLASEQDDDPTAELELLSEEACADDDPGRRAEAESDQNTFDFDRLGPDVDDAGETIATLKLDLQSRAQSISKLQFDIEQLRSRWTGLEKEIKVREEVTSNLTAELKLAHKRQSKTEKLLKKREKELDSLTAKFSAQEQSLEESARQIEQARKGEHESESRLMESQAQLDAAEDKLAALMKESLAGRSEQEQTSVRVKTLSSKVDGLKKDLAASRSCVSELQQYVDGRKSDWDEQHKLLADNEEGISQLTDELKEANSRLSDGGTDFDDLTARLASLKTERDELLKEITQLRKDAQDTDSAEKDKRMLAEQTGTLAGKAFEINELKNQIGRTETYADELRRQLQDQLAMTDTLQTRQKHLEISLTSANLQVEELSNGIEELRSSNALLRDKNSSLKEEFDKEIRQIRFELGEAQETIVDRDSLNKQLASDLVDTRETKMNLETRLGSTEEENKAKIEVLKKKLADVEVLNEELQHKLNTKNSAITALLDELTKRSESIESIGEIEEVIHDLDDRMSDSIDDRGKSERERITRLLVGKIDGQKLRFPLFKNRLTIGRTGHNDIQLKAAFISRRHAVIVTDGKNTRIVDWGSKNGVFVNTSRVKEQILRNGDIVTIGTADFKFEERRKR